MLHVVIHDRDKAGKLGAKQWAGKIRRCGPVKYVVLDLPYSETKGKDLRDYVQSCNGDSATKWQMLHSVIAVAPTQPKIEVTTDLPAAKPQTQPGENLHCNNAKDGTAGK